MKSSYLLYQGDFGRATAGYLSDLLPHQIKSTDSVDMLLQELPNVDSIILALWRPQDELCALLNKISYERLVAFLPLVMDARHLNIGPVVIPGGGSCWSCWAKRTKQHDPWAKHRSAVSRYYSANPHSGPAGYLESAAWMAATFSARILTSINGGDQEGGEIWQIDLLRISFTISRVIGVHDCPFCGLQRPAATRTYVDLQNALAEFRNL
jgi:bacteriocin biosynthesis cyclodehydratase domain-containing protein